jgi:hypothetical protein
MQCERRLVREDSGLIGPEPEHDKIFMIARRKVNEAIDAPTHMLDLPVRQVLVKQRQRVPCPGSLRGREVATIGLRDGEERIPVWSTYVGHGRGGHFTQILTNA